MDQTCTHCRHRQVACARLFEIERNAAFAGIQLLPAEVTAGDPSAIGTPAFIVGSLALGLVLTGVIPGSSSGAAIPIIVTATGLGQTIAAIWAARLGQNAIATVFGVFSGFWWSYAALVLGRVSPILTGRPGRPVLCSIVTI